ncbi:MAG: cytochrome C oxidase subunit II [Nitrospinae bacterium]|nr:cytochrome C oxidase subunit II [Nitrospinota bacterium]
MSLYTPEKHWWKPMDREEMIWVTIAFIWCQLITFIMPFSHAYGKHNPPAVTSKASTAEYGAKVDKFIAENKTGEEAGVAVVEVKPEVKEIYIVGRSYQWEPVLKLQQGKEYILHLSSGDYEHGMSIQPMNMNIMALPGYDYHLRITPDQAGEYFIICNEFCGAGHHMMTGKIYVS